MLLNLRKQGIIVLHTACGEITDVSINENDFNVNVYEDYIWAVLQKQTNIDALTSVFKSLGFDYNIKIVKKSKEQDKTKQIIESLTQKIGDILKVEE